MALLGFSYSAILCSGHFFWVKSGLLFYKNAKTKLNSGFKTLPNWINEYEKSIPLHF